MLEKFLNKKNIIAVVGASKNKEKYGYKILKTLSKEGFHVIGINPNYEEIEGIKCYPSLEEALKHNKIDVVITVVPPAVTELIIDECYKLGIKNIWMQPGSENERCIEKCNKLNLNCISKLCFIKDGLKIDFYVRP